MGAGFERASDSPGSDSESLPGLPSPWLSAVRYTVTRTVARPLLPIAAGFAAGCAHPTLPIDALWLCVFIAMPAAAVIWRRSAVASILLLALAGLGLSLGIARSSLASSDVQLDTPQSGYFTALGQVASEPVIEPHSIFFCLNLRSGGPKIAIELTGPAVQPCGADLYLGEPVSVDGVIEPVDVQTNGAGLPWGLSALGVTELLRARESDSVRPISARSNLFLRWAGALRRQCIEIFDRSLSPADSAAAAAILLGDKSRLSPATEQSFVATGTVHLLATAGLHVGILVILLRLLLDRLTLPRKASALIGIAAVWLYAAMAGGRPAVLRAAFIASIYFAAVLLERIPDLLSAISLGAITLLWIEPSDIGDPGFQLTFATVLGIVALMPALMQVWELLLSKMKRAGAKRAHAVKRLLEVESLSIAAQASAAPLVARYFSVVSVYGLLANLAACPLMFLLVPCAVLTLLAGAVWQPAGAAFGHWLLSPVLRAVTGVVGAVANLPHCAASVVPPSGLEIAAYYAVLLGACFAVQVAASQNRRDPSRRDLIAPDSAGGKPDLAAAAAPASTSDGH